LVKALSALRYERGRAWLSACRSADMAGARKPSLQRYGIVDIQRLARRLGGQAKHWTEWTEPL